MATQKKVEKTSTRKRDATKKATTRTAEKKTVKRSATKSADTVEKRPNARSRIAEKKHDVLVFLRSSSGIVSIACEKVGISRNTFYKWKREDAEFASAVDEIDERSLDFVEGCMFKAIEGGDSRLIMYYLNNKGRKRGYGVRSPSDDNKSNTITLRISEEESEY